MENVRKMPLGGGISIYVSNEYGFGTDAVLLADFAKAAPRHKVCDLGTGCGIIPLLLMREYPPKLAVGVEIQKEAFDVLNKSLNDNNLGSRLEFVNADLREIDTVFTRGSFDIVTCNPPYKKMGAGEISPHDAKGQARHELTCTIEDVAVAADKLLKFGGKLCVCQRPERISDVICTMRKFNIEPKQVRFVQQRIDTKPFMVLVEGRKGGNSGVICPKTLIIEQQNGEYSEEMRKIYRLYREVKG